MIAGRHRSKDGGGLPRLPRDGSNLSFTFRFHIRVQPVSCSIAPIDVRVLGRPSSRANRETRFTRLGCNRTLGGACDPYNNGGAR